MDKTHNPEFTMLEFYVAYKDYNWMMGFIEKMFEQVANKVCGKTQIIYNENKIEFKGPYKRLPFFEAIKNRARMIFQK